jgi:hypothetical protein
VIAYLDSSIVANAIFGSAQQLSEWPRLKHILLSSLVEVECFRALDRERLRRGLDDHKVAAYSENIRRVVARAEIIELSHAILERTKEAFPTQIATLDAIHVSTALLWKQWHEPKLVFATHDHQQAAGARAVGLKVIGV